MPQLKDVKNKVPQAICDMYVETSPAICSSTATCRRLTISDLRRAMSLTIDRQAFIDIIADGQGAIGGVMQPPPEGIWGMPPYAMRNLPGYDPDMPSSRAKALKIMEKSGLWPEQPAEGHGGDAQSRSLSRSRRSPDRSVEADLHRRRSQPDRHDPMVSDADAQGLQARDEHHRDGGRRSGRGILRELRFRLAAQLHQLLQPRGRQIDRPAIGGGQYREAQEAGMGDRAQTDRRRCPPDPLLQQGGDLPSNPTSKV